MEKHGVLKNKKRDVPSKRAISETVTPQGAFSPFFPSQKAVKRQKTKAKSAVEQRNDRILYEIPSSRRINPPSVWTVLKTKKCMKAKYNRLSPLPDFAETAEA